MASSPQQSVGTGTNTYVEVVPLTLHIGAEIRGRRSQQALAAGAIEGGA